MKKFLLMFLISSCIAVYISYKHPGFFLRLLSHTIKFVQTFNTGTSPTFVDQRSLEESPVLTLEKGVSEHSVTFFEQFVAFEAFNSGTENAPILILIIGMNEFSEQATLERYRRLAEEASDDGVIVLFPHYVDADQLLWAETIRRMIDVAQAIQNGNPNKVGLVGFFEGAKIASYVGTVEGNRLSAVSLHHSFLASQAVPENFEKFPPTLLTSYENSEEMMDLELLKEWLSHYEIENEVIVHELDEESREVDLREDNWQETMTFVKTHLGLVARVEPQPVKIELNPLKLEVFNMKSGASLTGQLMHETEKSYLVLTKENAHQMVSKSDVESRQKLAA